MTTVYILADRFEFFIYLKNRRKFESPEIESAQNRFKL